jgi:ABC-2 type transport system permease protein
VGSTVPAAPGQFWLLVRMWIRSTLAYPVSFGLMAAGNALITALDFVAVLIMFSHIRAFGGFSLAEMALLYGTASMALGLADLLIGSVERIGGRIRSGEVDVWLVRPVPAFVQAAADQFALRRLGRPVQAAVVLVLAVPRVDADWSVLKAALLVVSAFSGAVIFGSIFVMGAALQFVAGDASEVANSFTYGGQQLTQYPLTVFGRDIVRAATFVVPLAFVNYYPVLFVLDKPVPLGLPSWTGLLSPLVAAVVAVLGGIAWRTGIRRYRSTGS